MTGDDILNLAEKLLARDRSPSEALCRNVVGRAYYGAFHLARAFLASLGLTEEELTGGGARSERGHHAPPEWLKDSGVDSAKKAGTLLKNLYASRRSADYEIDRPRAIANFRDLQFVKNQVEIALDIKSLLNACAPEPVRSQILAGITPFRKRQKGPQGNA